MVKSSEFVDYVLELLDTLGPVTARRMFGGYGIFLDGLMFGLIANDMLYLKVDDETKVSYVERGLEAFSFTKLGKQMSMSYFLVPEEAMEDSEEMRLWAEKAYAVAVRTAATKKKH